MTRLKTIFVSDDKLNVDYEVNPAGDLWSYIFFLFFIFVWNDKKLDYIQYMHAKFMCPLMYELV